MSKIAQFSPLLEEKNHLSSIESKLSGISLQIETRGIGFKKLTQCKKDLICLQDLTLDLITNQTSPSIYQDKWSQLQEEVITALHACENKLLDRKVDELTEKAQTISLQLSQDIHSLQIKMKKFKNEVRKISQAYALSLENKKMLQVAESYLKSFSLHEGSVDEIKKATIIRSQVQKELEENPLQEESDTGITLYELAGDLYHHRLDLAKRHYFDLPLFDQKQLDEHLGQKGLKLENLKSCDDLRTWQHQLYPLIDGILGFVHRKIFGEETHLENRDIDDIFLDSSVVSHYQTSVNL